MPDFFVPSKLGAPMKKSVFERQKAEAEAKKAREQAETAAVYEDFVKSFDDEEENTLTNAKRGGHGSSNPSQGPGPAPGKRHFTSSGLKSGPGSLGQSPNVPKAGSGSLGSSGFGRKRQYDDYQGRRDRDRIFAYDDRSKSRDAAFDDEKKEADDEHAAKPTLHLSSLPPGTSPAVVKALFTSSPLVVDTVRILPSSAAGTDRKSSAAIVTLAADTAAADIDTVVSQLQNKYLGLGFNLSLSRHLSSVALGGAGGLSTATKGLDSHPFGAKVVPQHTSLSRAPPPGQGRFAPPASYTSSTPYGPRSTAPPTQVPVQPPSDLRQLKLIHKTLEGLLTYGPEFEALLMSRPQVQRGEHWAWLFNARSSGAVFYRWRLWEILTNVSNHKSTQRSRYGTAAQNNILFDGQSSWQAPEGGLKFEYTTNLEEFISDEDYNSSDEEEDDEGGLSRRYNDHNAARVPPPDIGSNDGVGYLNPLAKTKLVHLLARLPDTNAKLRKGDVARITAFAIEHAGAGADEVAALITRNAIKPFSTTIGREATSEDAASPSAKEKDDDKQDTTAASLVGLYVISDILSASASAGIRHAWRYRALFEAALRQQKVFERLGRVERDLGWGKMRGERWRHSIHSIFHTWEGWSVFPSAALEEFLNKFNNPRLSEKEKIAVEAEEKRKEQESQRSKSSSKWRSVQEEAMTQMKEDLDMADVDGTAVDGDDSDTEMRHVSPDPDVDGWSMPDSSDEEDNAGATKTDDQAPEPVHEPIPSPEKTSQATKTPAVKIDMAQSVRSRRPRAVDMFGDEDEID